MNSLILPDALSLTHVILHMVDSTNSDTRKIAAITLSEANIVIHGHMISSDNRKYAFSKV